MKRFYQKPELSVVALNFKDKIVASGEECISVWKNIGPTSCTTGTPELITVNN